MVKAYSLMIPTGIKLLINLHCPNFHHCCLCPTLFWTWWYIHHQRLSRKSRTLCFWWRRYYSMSDLWHWPKVGLSYSEWSQIIQGIASNRSLQTDYTRPLDPSQGHMPLNYWHFFRLYCCCSSLSRWFWPHHPALGTELCRMFSFLDHLQSDTDAPNATQSAVSQGTVKPFKLSTNQILVV